MALYQDNNREIRYLKNTEREQRIIGNYYRDIIRQYGIDVNYYKLKIPYMQQFKTVVDENTVLRHAYGYEEEPDYTLSADMISYMEVQDDLLQLDKYGIVPNTTVNFWFDREDFACSLAQKLGQLKEYKVKETEIALIVPECPSGDETGLVYYRINPDGSVEPLQDLDGIPEDELSDVYSYSLSDDIFPYALAFGVPQVFETEILSGRFMLRVGPYELGKEYTVVCEVVEHGDVKIQFPTNEWTANSFKRRVRNDDFVETMLFLTYTVNKVEVSPGRFRNILRGKLHGGVLFNDTHAVGKYMDLIHPDVGDVITIGFPSQESRQQYEITECTDKRISNDGINPLLGKYVWLCKAKRRVDNSEGIPEVNQDDERIKEEMELLDNADEIVAKKIADYDELDSDAVYGGYEREIRNHDRRAVDPGNPKRAKFIDDGSCIELFRFHDGCMLVTDGYELYYVDSKGGCCKLTTVEDEHVIDQNLVASGIQYLKSTDNALWFVNFDNRACRICEDESVTQGEIELCLNAVDVTTEDGPSHNENGQCFYKFRESKTVLISMNDNLYCRLGNDKKPIIKLT